MAWCILSRKCIFLHWIVLNPFGVNTRRRAVLIPFALRYGWNCRTQLFANLPVGWADTEVATPFFDESESTLGIGDLTFGLTRLLRSDHGTGQSCIATLRATAPNGSQSNPFFVNSSGLGNGAWKLGLDLLAVQPIDPVVLCYGVGYTDSFEQTIDGEDFLFGRELSYTFGVGFSANERVTLSISFHGSYVTES